METFTPGNNRGRFGSRSGDSRREFGGRSSGGFSRGRDRDSERDSRFGRSERRPLQMHDATCSECGKQCEIPFRPTGSRPVFCSDCFRKSDGGSGRSSRDDRPSSSGSGASSNQFAQINAKLDKILKVLQGLEIVTEDDEDEDTEEDSKNNSHAKKEVKI